MERFDQRGIECEQHSVPRLRLWQTQKVFPSLSQASLNLHASRNLSLQLWRYACG